MVESVYTSKNVLLGIFTFINSLTFLGLVYMRKQAYICFYREANDLKFQRYRMLRDVFASQEDSTSFISHFSKYGDPHSTPCNISKVIYIYIYIS